MLGGLSPALFMKQVWHKKPMLVRQALPGVKPPITRAQVFQLAASDAVESRLVVRHGEPGPEQRWSLDRGPLVRRSLPPLAQKGWTVLVQGLNLHVPAADELLSRFRFVPQARLDDLMISWASEGGGVGPHFDSYDVFLIQVQGRRRWRIGRMDDAELQPDVPLKIISNFRFEEELVLEPGDMLYLPPGWAHDGDAIDGECMTCSVGFRSPHRSELARETLLRLADAIDDEASDDIYRDPRQQATATPGRMPDELLAFASKGLQRLMAEPGALARALGEYMSEPKALVSFDSIGDPLPDGGCAVELDARSCMLYDERHVFLNGESWRAAGRDARMLQQLADQRRLDARTVRQASPALRDLLDQWSEDGWLHAVEA
ncbi:MAG: cupin domain-containing protein [Leptothrix sp. (in: b-proteobacteria)]